MPETYTGELDSFDNSKKPSDKDCSEMKKQHMDQLKKHKMQVDYGKEKLLQTERTKVFQHGKDIHTKYCHGRRLFIKLPAFVKRINGIWCLDLAVMDKLLNSYIGVVLIIIC